MRTVCGKIANIPVESNAVIRRAVLLLFRGWRRSRGALERHQRRTQATVAIRSAGINWINGWFAPSVGLPILEPIPLVSFSHATRTLQHQCSETPS